MKCVRVPSSQIHDVAADEARAVIGDCLDRPFELGARRGEAGDDRVHQHAGVDARVDQLADRAQPLQRVRRARFEPLPRLLVDGRHAHVHRARRDLRQRDEHVAVADDHRALGHEAHRVARAQRAPRSRGGSACSALRSADSSRSRCRRRRTRRVQDGFASSRVSTSTKFFLTRIIDANSSSAFISNCV